ncbi:MAG: peptide chain release factor N(5)-glutamine methyltransferase [Pseudomonadota bacterium]
MADEKLWTVRDVLDAARDFLGKRGVDNPRLDAELLLAHGLGVRRIDLYLQFDRPLGDEERAIFRLLLRRRGEREPVAYLTGHREFFGFPFEVSPEVLIPRPETELLVELVLRHAPQDLRMLDLCTGSGCVAIAVLAQRSLARAVAVDISPGALQVARRNAQVNGVAERLQLVRGDLAEALRGPLDVVVANPPYVTEDEWPSLAPEIRQHEPRLALTSAQGGLAHSRRIAAWLARHLSPTGMAAVECADSRGPATREVFAEVLGDRFPVVLERDLAGLDRVVRVGPVADPGSSTGSAEDSA